MEFVQITKDGIAGVATVPITALPHWTGHGWRAVDAEPKDDKPASDTPEPVPTQLPAVAPRTSRRAAVATEHTEE